MSLTPTLSTRYVGPYPENGDWPSHLHLALIINMLGLEGNYYGVCKKSEIGRYHVVCPNPAPFMRLPDALVAAEL